VAALPPALHRSAAAAALSSQPGTAAVPLSLQAPGTNHPLSEYQDEELLCLLGAASRDDVIYGLKHCAKHGHTLARG
jgi:hypothetical protein